MSVSDFQAVADAWGKKFSEAHGTKCRWVKLHADGAEMAQYRDYKISAKYVNTHYGAQQPLDAPGLVYTAEFANDTDLEQSATFQHEESTTATFSWALTTGLKVGLKVSGKVGLPVVAEGQVEASTELHFDTTTTSTETKTKTWSASVPFKVPPHSTVYATMTIDEKKYDIDFTSDIRISGWVAIWNEDQIDLGNGKHWLYFFRVATVIRELPTANYRAHGQDVIYRAKGKFSGVQGVALRVNLSQTKDGAATTTRLAIPASSAAKEACDDFLDVPLIGEVADDVATKVVSQESS